MDAYRVGSTPRILGTHLPGPLLLHVCEKELGAEWNRCTCWEEEGHEAEAGRRGLEGSPGSNPWNRAGTHAPYHVVARQQLLQELCLLVHHRLDDELVVTGDVEEGAAGARVRQLDQWLIAQRVLQEGW